LFEAEERQIGGREQGARWDVEKLVVFKVGDQGAVERDDGEVGGEIRRGEEAGRAAGLEGDRLVADTAGAAVQAKVDGGWISVGASGPTGDRRRAGRSRGSGRGGWCRGLERER